MMMTMTMMTMMMMMMRTLLGLIGSYWVRKKKGYATSQARHAVKRDATGDHVGSRWALSDREAEEVKV